MAAEFPTTLPSIARVSPTDYMNDAGKEADVLHNKLADEVEALAAVVGVTGSAVAGTVEERISIASLRRNAFGIGLSPYGYKRNFIRKKFSVFDGMASASTAWNNNRTGCTIADDGAINREENGSEASALLVTISAAYARFQRTFAAPVILSGTVNLWVYFDSDPTAASTFEFYLTSDYANFATKYIKYYYPVDSCIRKGWNCLSMNSAEDGTTTPATVTVGGGESWSNAMNGAKIIANGLASGQTFRVGGIFFGGEARPNVLINIDDAYSSVWQIFNLARSREIPLSLSVITGKVGTAGYLSWDQIDAMYDWGLDIIPHSVTHPAGGLDALTEAEAIDEIEQSRDALLARGYTRLPQVFAWPENDYTASGFDLIELARQAGFVMSRGSTRRDLPTAQGIDNPMRLPSADIGGKTLAQALKLLDAAERYKQTNIIYGHKLVGTETSPAAGGSPPVNTLEWYWSDWVSFLDSVSSRYSAGTLTPITYSELQNECRY